jgi:hypothetical protein
MSGGPVQGIQYPSAPAISGLEKVNPSVIAQSEHSPAPESYGKQERSNADATAIVRAPLVSVIVAVYNVEKYLCQCLDSLAHQTLNNIEILVVTKLQRTTAPRSPMTMPPNIPRFAFFIVNSIRALRLFGI